MTDPALPVIRRRNYAAGHSYTLDGMKVPGVTTLIGDGFPKPALIAWGPRVVADYVADRLTVDGDHVLADDLVTDLADLARAKRRPFPDDGVSITKVAETLKGVHWEDRDTAANRGTQVHRLAEALARGDEVHPPDEVAGHVDSYLRFLDDWHLGDDALVELVVANTRHRYCGTLDMVVTIPGLGRCLLDIKTNRTGPFDEVALQLAAYRYCDLAVDPATGDAMPMPEVDWCGVVWLRADGYDLIPYHAGPAEFRMFLYVREVALWLGAQRDRDQPGVKGAAITPAETVAP